MQFFKKAKFLLGMIALLLGMVALYIIYVDKKSDVGLINYDSVGFKVDETYSTPTGNDVSQDSIQGPIESERLVQPNELTTDDADLKEEEESSKLVENDTAQDSIRTTPQNTIPTETNISPQPEDSSYKVISDRVIATPSNAFPAELLVKYYTITMTMKSPVDLHIYDDQSNHTGIMRKSGHLPYPVSNIPGSTFDRVSGHQVITLQGDRPYNVVLEGMSKKYVDYHSIDNETFSLEVEINYDGDVVKKVLFSAPPTSSKSKGSMTISSKNSLSALKLDFDGDGQVDTTVEPTDLE